MRKKARRVLAALGAGVVLPLYLSLPGHVSKKQRARFAGFNYAHRGLHAPDRSVPENSLAAFRLAAKEGYGIELDVQLSKDGQVVVFHDDTLPRVCGVEGPVDGRSFAELRKLRLCGTEERIPLLSEVLASIDGAGPLIVELKTGRRNRELCRKTYALLKKYPGTVCIESFNPFIVAWFRFHAPRMLRGQLVAPAKEYRRDGMGWPTSLLLSRNFFNPLSRPQFIAHRIGRRPLNVRLTEKLGALRFGWTSHEQANEKGRDGVIFEFYRPKLKFK